MTIECSTYEFECIFLLIEWWCEIVFIFKSKSGNKLNEKGLTFAGKTQSRQREKIQMHINMDENTMVIL